jgi:GNAT superfamily N-acetyltransferase
MAEAAADRLVLKEYCAERDDGEALELERACVQGTSYRLSFRRERFELRARLFGEHRILTARLQGRLVGTVAAALKDAELWGRPVRAAFYFDLRVHPAVRGRGVARRLIAEIDSWARPRSDLGYLYTMADNRIVSRLAGLFGAADVGGYAYLVYPTYRPLSPRQVPRPASAAEVHAALLRCCGPFDFLCGPLGAGPLGTPHAGSWIVESAGQAAGCSAWSMRGILSEVIEAVPRALDAVQRLSRKWPLRLVRWPHLPVAGEELRSWYLFDFHATDASLARDLVRHVAAEAREHGIDYLYLVFGPRDRWLRAVRSDVPRIFAPVVPYRGLARLPEGGRGRVDRLYVDVRDL